MQRLDTQTEQLKKIEADTEVIDSNLDQSEYLLRGLKPFGWVRNLFRKDPGPPPRPEKTSGGYPTGAAPSSASGAPDARRQGGASAGANRLLAEEAARKDLKLGAAGSNGSQLRPDQKRDQEVDRAYDDIEHMLDGLKEKSKVINRTLDDHNQMLPRIGDSIARDQERINKQQQDMKKRMSGR